MSFYNHVTESNKNLNSLTLPLREGFNCCNAPSIPKLSIATLTRGPSAKLSKMASSASAITQRLLFPVMTSQSTAPKVWE